MKNKLSFITGFITSAIIFTSITVFAEDSNIFTAMKATFGIVIDGENFESENPVVAIDGKTYLPLKETGDVLGVDVKWNAEKRQVEINKDGENVIKEVSPTPIATSVENITPTPITTPIVTGKATTVDYKETEPYIKNINGKDIHVIDYKGVLYIEFAEFSRQYPKAPHTELMKIKSNFIVRPTTVDTKSYIKYDVVKEYMQ